MNEYIMKRINSESYRDRFVAEYLELQVRTKRLRAMLEKWDAGKLEFVPNCTRATYKFQLDAMDKYLAVLEIRGKLEGIDLEKAEKEHRENRECDDASVAGLPEVKCVPVTDVRDDREIRIFVSQPMHGKKISEIFEVIECAEAELSEAFPNRRITVMYEYIINNYMTCGSPLNCFAYSIYEMDSADVVAFAPGWSEARGCILEHSVAEKYGKRIMYMKGAETNESTGC